MLKIAYIIVVILTIMQLQAIYHINNKFRTPDGLHQLVPEFVIFMLAVASITLFIIFGAVAIYQ